MNKIEETVKRLDLISGVDPENAHRMADDILLEFVPLEVRAAYEKVQQRCSWWACA